MTAFRRIALCLPLLCAAASSAQAGACDYRPSQLLRPAASAAGAALNRDTSDTGGEERKSGIYTLVNATTGVSLSSTSWAGTVAAGASSVLSGAVALITAPAAMIAGAVTAVGAGAFEGACYFTEKRITDYREVNAIVRDIAVTAPDENYVYTEASEGQQDARVKIRKPGSEPAEYDDYAVADLYIVDGVLKHRDKGRDSTVGLIGQIEE
ncbi:hypothetical protein KM176_02700 [Pseudooceanicola sp. CBS1P-1]|uniref:Uncharacterized protein n=1 Tax=Pseudooceanicola albus TaxID=2692189 RepID=A0A6L7G1C5_9RHOB|nr:MULTISPECIES: hypothetical protein [Pseudooceanicola]MBT9382760.1 hypothetical protein [Pseudooceanicola endophyticus]MXN17298.1 hypothetical protein [Pseudooceanicola albus]